MRFKHDYVTKELERWHAQRGFWSFLVLHDVGLGNRYYASYRDQRRPIGLSATTAASIMFHENKELRGEAANPTPIEFGYLTIDDATRACEAKYKQLIVEKL